MEYPEVQGTIIELEQMFLSMLEDLYYATQPGQPVDEDCLRWLEEKLGVAGVF
jgi:hypothetical protein